MRTKSCCTQMQLEKVAEQYGTEMLRVCWIYRENRQQAQTDVQQAMILLYQNTPQADTYGRIEALQAAVEACRQAPVHREKEKVADLQSVPAEYRTLLHQFLQLGETDRWILYLSCYLTCSIQEIAQIMNLPCFWVKACKKHGMKQLDRNK